MSFTFNGTTSDDFFLYVEQYPNVGIPRRKMQTFSVPGRNGDIILPTDSYENITQEYDIYLSAQRAGMKLPELVRSITRWLCVPGYHELVDSYDPGVFRQAYFAGGLDIENTLQRFGRATIQFSCAPQRFLQPWNESFTLTAATTIGNPGRETAKPEITLHGSGEDGVLNINGNRLVITGTVEGLTLNCEDHEAMLGGVYVNTQVTGTWPELPAGESSISWSGAITSVTIKPRFFDL